MRLEVDELQPLISNRQTHNIAHPDTPHKEEVEHFRNKNTSSKRDTQMRISQYPK